MMTKTRLARWLVAGMLASGVAQAAQVNANATVDLNSGLFQFQALSGGPVSIANGDSVSFAVDFLGNQTLTINNGGELLRAWLYGEDNNSMFTINNAVISLLGFSGTGGALSTYSLGTQSSGAVHLGPELSDFLTSGQSVTFSGFQATYDVQSIAVSPHSYLGAWLFVDGTTQIGVMAQQVPEPSSIALLGLSLAGLTAARRRRPLSASALCMSVRRQHENRSNHSGEQHGVTIGV